MSVTAQTGDGAQASVNVSPGRATPATDEDFTKLKDQFDTTVTNTIGAKVASLAALAVPIVTAFCAWLQKKIGIKLDPSELTAFIVTMGAGIVITAYKWLANRGQWERAVLEAYHVYLTGQAATSNQVVVTPAAPPRLPNQS